MKHYFWFVPHCGAFTQKDVVIKMSVGSSMREQAKLELIKQYAQDCGFYLEPVSDTSDAAIEQLANSLFAGSRFALFYLRTMHLGVSQVYQMIIDGVIENLSTQFNYSAQTLKLISLFSPSYFLSHNQSICHTFCQRPRRKYLSHQDSTQFSNAVIGGCLILVLFLISGYLEGIARATHMF